MVVLIFYFLLLWHLLLVRGKDTYNGENSTSSETTLCLEWKKVEPNLSIITFVMFQDSVLHFNVTFFFFFQWVCGYFQSVYVFLLPSTYVWIRLWIIQHVNVLINLIRIKLCNCDTWLVQSCTVKLPRNINVQQK